MSLLGGLRLPVVPLAPPQPQPQAPDPAAALPPEPAPAPDQPVAEPSGPPAADPAPQNAAQPAEAPAAATPPLAGPVGRLPAETALRAIADAPPDDLAEARRLALAAQERFLLERMVERLATPPVPAPALLTEPDRKPDPQRVAPPGATLDLRR